MLRGKRNCLICGLSIAVDARGGNFSRTILREGWHSLWPPGSGDTEGMESAVPAALPRLCVLLHQPRACPHTAQG